MTMTAQPPSPERLTRSRSMRSGAARVVPRESPACLWRDEPGAGPVPRGTDARCLSESRRGCRLADVAWLDMAWPARLWGEQPDITPVGKRGEGVDQRLRKVAVFLPEPHQDHVDNVFVILIDKLDAIDSRER